MSLIVETRRIMRRALVLAMAGALGLFGYLWWERGQGVETTNNAYLKADLVQVAASVEGTIKTISITENSTVRRGDLLFELEPERAKARVLRAQSAVAASEAELTAGVEAIEALKAKTRRQASVLRERMARAGVARSELESRNSDLARMRALAQSGSVSERQRESAETESAKAEAELAMAEAAIDAERSEIAVLEADLARAEAALEGARAAVAEARAAAELEEIALRDARITAPIAGRIGNLTARIGEHVEPGKVLLNLVPRDLYVVANFKETQIGRMRIGSPSRIRVDAFPDLQLAGVVESFAPATGSEFSILPPQNATGNFTKIVQRVPVHIRLTNIPGDRELPAGLSVVVSVDIGEPNSPGSPASRPAPARLAPARPAPSDPGPAGSPVVSRAVPSASN